MKIKYTEKDRKKLINHFVYNIIPTHPKLNEEAYKRIFEGGKDNLVDKTAIALTHFCFRNGPVENMHANNQLSQNDMMTLNKYMVNTLAYALDLIFSKRWVEFELLLEKMQFYGTDWDKPIKDDNGLTDFLKQQCLSSRKNILK